MAKAFDVVGVGLNATDTVLLVPHFPEYAGKAPFTEEVMSPGGQVASAIVACQRLGLRSKYIGSVGDDLRGTIQMRSLLDEGINVDHVQIRLGCPNQSAYIIVDQRTGERTIFWRRDDSLRLDASQIDPGQITCARLLHIDGHDTEAVAHAARVAREAGMPVTVDVDTIYHGFERVLQYVDYLIASSEFPVQWTNERDPFRALRLMQEEYEMKVAAMTLGAYGALAYSEGRFHYSPAFVVSCADTTGAGDVFHGAFCYALLEDYPLEAALEFSNAMAALNCRVLGARGGIGTRADAEKLIARAERRSNKDFELRATVPVR